MKTDETAKKRIPVILDGDPGHDDAIAWLLAKASEKLTGTNVFCDIQAVTTVAGNVALEKTTLNARRICTLLKLDAPIAMGAPHPLTADLMHAPSVHGESGLDGPALPEADRGLYPQGAVSLMAEVLANSPDPVTIISTGPMTNTAALLLAHPELKPKIGQISFMGGGIGFGNWTPAAEFNILVDPEAADIVLKSGIPLIMAGLDVTEKALVLPADFEQVKAIGNPVSDIVWQWLEFFYRFHRTIGYEGAPMHDPCAVMALLHPEFFTMQPMFVQVETGGSYCRGATIGDAAGVLKQAPNVTCLTDVDRDAFARCLIEAVGTYD